jgi:hypothetical protein
MQMGRWFGFRPGYKDLVRVFLGVKEGRRGDTDLVSLFKDVCRMEERFRDEIKRYNRRPGAERITPKQIPPLISVSGSLPPTARNKMFNAVLASKNFGGQRSMLTLAPAKPAAMDENINTVTGLLTASKSLGTMFLSGISRKNKEFDATAIVLETTNEQVIAFLRAYRWLETDYKDFERPVDTSLQIEFLKTQKHDIASWLILAPQRKKSFGQQLTIGSVGNLAVKERHRVGGRGFQVFGEPVHRTIAEYLAGIEPGNSSLTLPNAATESVRNKHRGVFLLYPVREKQKDKISIGFELFFPYNRLPFDINFTVRRKSEEAQIIVEDSKDAS